MQSAGEFDLRMIVVQKSSRDKPNSGIGILAVLFAFGLPLLSTLLSHANSHCPTSQTLLLTLLALRAPIALFAFQAMGARGASKGKSHCALRMPGDGSPQRKQARKGANPRSPLVFQFAVRLDLFPCLRYGLPLPLPDFAIFCGSLACAAGSHCPTLQSLLSTLLALRAHICNPNGVPPFHSRFSHCLDNIRHMVAWRLTRLD